MPPLKKILYFIKLLHLTKFEDYPHGVACLSATEYEQVKQLTKGSRKQTKVLAILGNSQRINIRKGRIFLFGSARS